MAHACFGTKQRAGSALCIPRLASVIVAHVSLSPHPITSRTVAIIVYYVLIITSTTMAFCCLNNVIEKSSYHCNCVICHCHDTVQWQCQCIVLAGKPLVRLVLQPKLHLHLDQELGSILGDQDRASPPPPSPHGLDGDARR